MSCIPADIPSSWWRGCVTPAFHEARLNVHSLLLNIIRFWCETGKNDNYRQYQSKLFPFLYFFDFHKNQC